MTTRYQKYSRTKKGLARRLYRDQKARSRRRGDSMPAYTSDDLYLWLISQVNFDKVYSNWVDSGYKTDLAPSVDRLNDYVGYTFDNIQLTTWGENNRKGYADRVSGKNTKLSKTIIQMDSSGNIINTFYSCRQMARETGFSRCHILNRSLSNLPAYGYIWEYK